MNFYNQVRTYFENIKDDEMYATLIHELSHVKRAYGPWYGETLFDYMIFEGLALNFEEEICSSKSYYPNYIRNLGNPDRLIKKFESMFDYTDEQYNYMDFVLGNKEKGIPEHAVYIMGVEFVDTYLKEHKKATPHSLLLKPSRIFRKR